MHLLLGKADRRRRKVRPKATGLVMYHVCVYRRSFQRDNQPKQPY